MTAKLVQRWLLFIFLVVAIVVLVLLPFENICGEFLWPWAVALILPGDMIVGTLDNRSELGRALTYSVALLFWGCIGYFYARWTLRIRTFHFVLLAYPVMWAALWVFVAPIYFLFENVFGIYLGSI